MRHNYFDEKQGYYSVGDGGDDNDNQVKCRPLEEKGKTFFGKCLVSIHILIITVYLSFARVMGPARALERSSKKM